MCCIVYLTRFLRKIHFIKKLGKLRISVSVQYMIKILKQVKPEIWATSLVPNVCGTNTRTQDS